MYARIIHTAGDTIEVENKFTWECPPKSGRSKNFKPSEQAVKKHNEQLAQDALRRLINHNFKPCDLHIIFTFKEDQRPDRKESRKIMDKFNREMRKEYAKLELTYKFIRITGWIDKDYVGDEPIPENVQKHKEVAEHHHMIMSAIDYKLIVKHWPYGRVWFFPLDTVADYTSLANYFFRHTNNNFRNEDSPLKKRWSPSRNLEKPPPPKKKKIKARNWNDVPKPFKGYQIVTDSIKIGVNEYTGYPYQFYRMVKIPDMKTAYKRN